jgi:hypothetical protein
MVIARKRNVLTLPGYDTTTPSIMLLQGYSALWRVIIDLRNLE